jgi:hypothetical protein
MLVLHSATFEFLYSRKFLTKLIILFWGQLSAFNAPYKFQHNHFCLLSPLCSISARFTGVDVAVLVGIRKDAERNFLLAAPVWKLEELLQSLKRKVNLTRQFCFRNMQFT